MTELSAIKSVDLSSVRVRTDRSPFTTKTLSLEVGQGFEVEGRERSDISAQISALGRKEKRSFATKKIGELHYLVYRYA